MYCDIPTINLPPNDPIQKMLTFEVLIHLYQYICQQTLTHLNSHFKIFSSYIQIQPKYYISSFYKQTNINNINYLIHINTHMPKQLNITAKNQYFDNQNSSNLPFFKKKSFGPWETVQNPIHQPHTESFSPLLASKRNQQNLIDNLRSIEFNEVKNQENNQRHLKKKKKKLNIKLRISKGNSNSKSRKNSERLINKKQIQITNEDPPKIISQKNQKIQNQNNHQTVLVKSKFATQHIKKHNLNRSLQPVKKTKQNESQSQKTLQTIKIKKQLTENTSLNNCPKQRYLKYKRNSFRKGQFNNGSSFQGIQKKIHQKNGFLITAFVNKQPTITRNPSNNNTISNHISEVSISGAKTLKLNLTLQQSILKVLGQYSSLKTGIDNFVKRDVAKVGIFLNSERKEVSKFKKRSFKQRSISPPIFQDDMEIKTNRTIICNF